VEKVMKMDQTKENKARMQEELIRTASSKIADREANAERTRRIKENKKRVEDVERQETVELLLNVQKQLLDTCGHLQVGNVRSQALPSCGVGSALLMKSQNKAFKAGFQFTVSYMMWN
jgi:hypothetical protein